MSSRVVAALVALLTLVVHLPALWAGFVTLDDPLYITNNPRILNGALSELWSARAALDGKYIEFFPLRDTVYWLVARVSLSPVGFHAVVVAFHMTATALVVLVARSLGVPLATAAIAGALFAVHPAHTESTAWIAGLKDTMFLTFMLAAFRAYVAWDTHGRRRDMALALVALIAALLCKGMAIVFPGLVFVHALTLGARTAPPVTTWPRAIVGASVRTAPFAAVVLVMLVTLFIPVGAANDVIIETPLSGGERVLFALWLVVRYAALLVAPFRLRIWHLDTFIDEVDPLRVTLLIAFWLAFAALVVWSWRRGSKGAHSGRVVAFACAWFVLALVPVLNLIPFPAVFADRYSFAASVGVCIALAIGVAALPVSDRVRNAVVAIVVVTLGSLTFVRGLQWGDEPSLWQEVVDDAANAPYPQPWQKLAEAQLAHGDVERAAEVFARVIAMSPSSPQPLAERQLLSSLRASVDLHVRLGRGDVARAHAAQLVALTPLDARAWELAARASVAAGERDEAAERARRGLALAPDAGMRWNLALLLGDAPDAGPALAGALADDARLCAVFARWRVTAPPAVAAIVAERASAQCP